MGVFSQRSFGAGEIAPALYARSDTVKVSTGVRTARNVYVMRHGGLTNRPGTKFIGEVKDSSKAVRLLKFVFNTDQSYVLEFGHQYFRVIRGGAYVRQTAKTITGIDQANPGVFTTSAAHGYSVGD